MEIFEWMEKVYEDARIRKKSLTHSNWRVRYSAAVALGETEDPNALEDLAFLWQREQSRQLYTQPKVKGFTNSYDDTRMAEQIVEIAVIFDRDYDQELLEDWKCRGRVRQAILCAVEKIGRINQSLLRAVYDVLADEGEDYAVKMQGCRVLGRCGDHFSLPYLEKALTVDEWCTQTEAQKAIKAIRQREGGAVCD